MTHETFNFNGETRRYTAVELAKIRVVDARRIIEKRELQWYQQEFGKKVLLDASIGNRYEDTNRAKAIELHSEKILWTLLNCCKECEGVGHFFTQSGATAADCSECDGSGDSDDYGVYIWTDLDGNILPEEP